MSIKIKDVTIRTKLIVSFSVLILLFSGIIIFLISTMNSLSELQDAGAKRAKDSVHIEQIKMRGDELYSLFADTIINSKIEESQKEFKEFSVQSVKDIEDVHKLADTDKEKEQAKLYDKHYSEYLSMFDGLVRLLKQTKGAVTDEVRKFDNKIDAIRDETEKELDVFAKSLEHESIEADKHFDETISSAIKLAIIILFAGITIGAVFAYYIISSISGGISGVLGQFRKLIRQVLDGRLASRGSVDDTDVDFREVMSQTNSIIDSLVMQINNMPVTAVLMDKEFNITYANDSAVKLLGQSREQLIGTKCYNHFKTSDCNTSDCACARAVQSGVETTRETQAHPRGLDLDIVYTGVPLRDLDGKITGVMETVVDQTAIKTAQRVSEKQAKYQSVEVGRLIENLNMLALGNNDISAVVAEFDPDTKLLGENFMKINDNLNILIGAMNEIAELSRKIADGDLTVSLQARSDKDKLMIAIKDMVANLKDIIDNVQNASAQVASGSEELSSGAQEMAQSASEQAASIEELSSSMEEMSSTVSQNADNARETASIAEKTAKDAVEGGKSVSETVSAMKSIAEKIGIIEDIARQTNMLALNAAIEAARAGEHGKGFAVVADEVRNLAGRSGDAAREISELSSKSVAIAEKAGKLIEEIVPQIRKTAELVQEINASSSEQANGIEQVTQSITQLDKTIQQNSAATEQMASTSEELSGQAVQLQTQAGFFKLDSTSKTAFIDKPKKNPAKPLKNNQFKQKVVNRGGIELNMSDEDDSSFEKF